MDTSYIKTSVSGKKEKLCMSLLTSEQDKAIDQITQRLKKKRNHENYNKQYDEYFHFCLTSS